LSRKENILKGAPASGNGKVSVNKAEAGQTNKKCLTFHALHKGQVKERE